jgi:hypothetical protein
MFGYTIDWRGNDTTVLTVDRLEEGAILYYQSRMIEYRAMQTWQLAFVSSNKWNVGIGLIHRATGLMAAPESVEAGARIVLMRVPDDGRISADHAWQTNFAYDHNWRSLMPLKNKDLIPTLEFVDDVLRLAEWTEPEGPSFCYRFSPVWY